MRSSSAAAAVAAVAVCRSSSPDRRGPDSAVGGLSGSSSPLPLLHYIPAALFSHSLPSPFATGAVAAAGEQTSWLSIK